MQAKPRKTGNLDKPWTIGPFHFPILHFYCSANGVVPVNVGNVMNVGNVVNVGNVMNVGNVTGAQLIGRKLPLQANEFFFSMFPLMVAGIALTGGPQPKNPGKTRIFS